MIPQLYFLRSSEQKIVTDMLKYAYVEDTPNLNIYSDFYGLTAKDLGLYALVDNHIAGAIWSRRLNSEHNSTAFVDEKTPVLSMAVLPEFRAKGVGTFMMDQFLQEAGALYEQLSVGVLNNSKTIKFYKKFGFEIVDNSEQKIITMIKKLEKKEVFRPTDGYDPTKWMD
jgi:ribosomal protein S18 acetylase RimI-like enzyme